MRYKKSRKIIEDEIPELRPVSSPWYTHDKITLKYLPGRNYKIIYESNDDGLLYVKGKKLTKVRSIDIPDDYAEVIINGSKGYASPKCSGLRYITALEGDKFLDNELLYVAYDGPLEIYLNCMGFEVIQNFEFVLCGDSIVRFLQSCRFYYNIERVAWIMDRRMKRLREACPEQAEELIGDYFDAWDLINNY